MSNRDVDTETPMLVTVPPQSGRNLMQYIATISVSLGAFCAGTVLSWTSPALPYILVVGDNSSNTMNSTIPGFTINQNEAALVGSMLTIGALVAAIPTGYLADRIGRKATILGLAIMFLINWIIISLSRNIEMLVAARFFAGMGLGGICVAAPIYIGEIAETSRRGMFGSFFQLFLSCGILFTCCVGYVANWLGLALVLGVTPILFGFSFLFMPETPTYLIEQNKMLLAEESLRKLRGSFYDISAEMKMIEMGIIESHKKSATLSDLLFDKANLKSTVSMIGVLAFQQLSGINAVVFYTVNIFKDAGTGMSPFLSAIIINLVQVGVSYLSILIIEKANRKFYLMLSSVGMILSHTGLGMFFHMKSLEVDTTHLVLIPLISCVLYMVSFSIGYGPVPWMLLGELFSPEIKGVASGVAILINWIFAFFVTFSFPILNEYWGIQITFYFLAGVMAAATLFVHLVVPETRGKSLQEIQQDLKG